MPESVTKRCSMLFHLANGLVTTRPQETKNPLCAKRTGQSPASRAKEEKRNLISSHASSTGQEKCCTTFAATRKVNDAVLRRNGIHPSADANTSLAHGRIEAHHLRWIIPTHSKQTVRSSRRCSRAGFEGEQALTIEAHTHCIQSNKVLAGV